VKESRPRCPRAERLRERFVLNVRTRGHRPDAHLRRRKTHPPRGPGRVRRPLPTFLGGRPHRSRHSSVRTPSPITRVGRTFPMNGGSSVGPASPASSAKYERVAVLKRPGQETVASSGKPHRLPGACSSHGIPLRGRSGGRFLRAENRAGFPRLSSLPTIPILLIGIISPKVTPICEPVQRPARPARRGADS